MQMSVRLEPSVKFPTNLPRVALLSLQWLPESARYDVLSGNQEKAIATLKRIATENGAPMPLGKLVISRQVSSRSTHSVACVSLRGQGCTCARVGPACV